MSISSFVMHGQRVGRMDIEQSEFTVAVAVCEDRTVFDTDGRLETLAVRVDDQAVERLFVDFLRRKLLYGDREAAC